MGTVVCVCEVPTPNDCLGYEISEPPISGIGLRLDESLEGTLKPRDGTLGKDIQEQAPRRKASQDPMGHNPSTRSCGSPSNRERRLRGPTGLFSLELDFLEGDEETSVNIENNALEVDFDSDTMTVTQVRPDSPAHKMGVKPGMVLKSVAGQDISDKSAPEGLDVLNEALRELPPVPKQEDTGVVPSDSPINRQRSMSAFRTVNRKVSFDNEKLMQDDIYLTGTWANWSSDFPEGWLEPVQGGSKGTALLKLCVKLTSQSFTFQVITPEHDWKWHLYPHGATPIKIGWISSHVSKEGLLSEGLKDHAVVGLGNDKLGHGVNFHVVEKPGTTVTIYVQVPSKPSDDGTALALRTDTVEGACIWYTVEDTGLQLTAGDGVNLSWYKSYLPKEYANRLD